MEHLDLLEKHLVENNLPCDGTILARFVSYAALLKQYNRVMNLTAKDSDFDIVTRHFMDSVMLAKACTLEGKKLLDVGCGAGFPSLPCKILYPDMPVFLLDATEKKLTFINHVIEQLQLSDAQTIYARAELLAHEERWRETFSLVTSRAVARLSMLSELSLPFVLPGGMFAPLKLANHQEELSAAQPRIEALGGQTAQPFLYTLPDSEVDFAVLRIKKEGQTPAKYPRSFSAIKKDSP